MDALALTGEEGRVTCEKLRGAGKGIDTEISEWGNLVRVESYRLQLNT